ncbi:hypothetical protein BDY19DRAFT_114224 [Irpex rosettiformis]|uniref:Uncharacterized protein n=1 Tax=Irpex rosettiformis TaxID=378272 RepID=A0ACB8U6N1_9APHY|nr:hypothetical protein BDY19DRAFT_114224 [Irpex rosettiformis]
MAKINHMSLCYCLHTVLIIVYVALVVLASHHYEHGLNFPFTSPADQTVMSNIVVVVAQTFSTLYLAVLVLVTQRLALVLDLHTQQTLTAIHDKSSAWLGIGSSIFVLVDQVKIPAAISSVVYITTYLTGVAVLHITLPASVSVNTYNATALTKQATKLARPLNVNLQSDTNWDILRLYKQLPRLGLRGLDGNRIYDVIPITPMAVNETVVNATSFEVYCGLASNATQKDVLWGGSSIGALDVAGWSLESDLDFTFILGTTSLSPSCLRSKPLYSDDGTSYSKLGPNFIVFASTIPIVDDSGASATSIGIHPSLLFPTTDEGVGAENITVDSIQLTACNVYTVNSTIKVSTADGKPLDQAVSRSSVWSNWTIPQPPNDPLLNNISLAAIVAPDGARDQSFKSTSGANTSPYGIVLGGDGGEDSVDYNETIYLHPPSILDQFIMKDLMVTQWPPDTDQKMLLSDLQFSIGKAIAAIVWYYHNGNYTSANRNVSDLLSSQDRVGEATIEVVVTRMRLDFNVVLLAIGLGVSCMLLAVIFLLSFHSRREVSNDLDAAGILQLTWLLGNERHFAGIPKPDRQELRKAGMFDVQISTWVKRKTVQAMEYYEVSELTNLNSRTSDTDALEDNDSSRTLWVP